MIKVAIADGEALFGKSMKLLLEDGGSGMQAASNQAATTLCCANCRHPKRCPKLPPDLNMPVLN